MSEQQLTFEATAGADGLAVVVALLGTETVYRDSIDLRKAADVERFAAAVSASVPALRSEAIAAELRAIDPARLPVVAGADDAWPEPDPVDRATVPAFPVDVLPEPLRAWVAAVAEATQTPADLAGLLGLAVCAGAVARRLVIEAGRGWFEPLNLYVAVLLDPGNRKSAVFSEAMRPLRLIERELTQAATPEIARLRADRRVREAAMKAAEKKAAARLRGCDGNGPGTF